MSKKSENAKNLYIQGIKEGKVEVVKEYSGSRYTQHSTGVADGAQGFMDFFKGFVERTTDRDIRIIRAIEDGAMFLYTCIRILITGPPNGLPLIFLTRMKMIRLLNTGIIWNLSLLDLNGQIPGNFKIKRDSFISFRVDS